MLDETFLAELDFKNASLGVDLIEIRLTGKNYFAVSDLGKMFLDFVNALPKSRVIFIVGEKEVTEMQLKDNGSLAVAIQATDAKGNPTSLDPGAVPAWALSDASFGSLTPSSDGMSAQFVPSGKLGDLQVQCSIPAVGSEPALSGSLPVTVIASDAVAIVLSGTAS